MFNVTRMTYKPVKLENNQLLGLYYNIIIICGWCQMWERLACPTSYIVIAKVDSAAKPLRFFSSLFFFFYFMFYVSMCNSLGCPLISKYAFVWLENISALSCRNFSATFGFPFMSPAAACLNYQPI